MANWDLTKGLKNLRGQLNTRWPNRDHASDGTIGDEAHQAEMSGHNPDDTAGSKAAWNGDPDSTPEVRAFDCDSDFREAGVNAQMVVDHIRALPGVSSVLRYMIYNRKMYHERDGFRPTAYTGPSAHTEHIHFEGAWSQAADNDTTFNYRLEEVGDMPLTEADADVILNRLAARLKSQGGLASPTDTLVTTLRAVAWQYQGGGLQGATSALDAIADGQALAGKLDVVIEAIKNAGVTLTDAQVKAIGDAVGNAANAAMQEIITKLERAGAALTQ
jgi:hypothetical protein